MFNKVTAIAFALSLCASPLFASKRIVVTPPEPTQSSVITASQLQTPLIETRKRFVRPAHGRMSFNLGNGYPDVSLELSCSETLILGFAIHGSCARYVLTYPDYGSALTLIYPVDETIIYKLANSRGVTLAAAEDQNISPWHAGAPAILGLGFLSLLCVRSRWRNIRLRRRAKYRGALPYHLKYPRGSF